jgi:hypothetical protein
VPQQSATPSLKHDVLLKELRDGMIKQPNDLAEIIRHGSNPAKSIAVQKLLRQQLCKQ